MIFSRQRLPVFFAILLSIFFLFLLPIPRYFAQVKGGTEGRQQRVAVRVLVITMFAGETAPWTERESLTRKIDIAGMTSPLQCSEQGLCVTTIGVGKSNAAASMTAILRSDQLDLSKAYFITAGIGGTPPDKGTLGFAAWADWIVDWDLGHHLLPESVPGVPYGYLPGQETGTNVFKLNPGLVNLAYQLTEDLELTDSEAAKEARSHYPEQRGKKPYVTRCDTITGDDYWAGAQLSKKARYITDLHTKEQGDYCTAQMEDTAVATALQRFGHLNRYLNLRTASNFDQPYEGQSMKELLSSYPGYRPAVDNAYLVASVVARHLMRS